MLVIRPYRREFAVRYAARWAFSQNPLFGDFRGVGGNCTNFVSQCVYAGSCQMNYLPLYGWYYISQNERAPSWTGVPYFYNFITGNTGVGPFGREVTADEAEVGDVIQLGRAADGFYHTLIIVGFSDDDVLVAAQTNDAYERPLSSYEYEFLRYIKILGVRFRTVSSDDCFLSVYDGKSFAALDVPMVPPVPEDGAPSADENQSITNS